MTTLRDALSVDLLQGRVTLRPIEPRHLPALGGRFPPGGGGEAPPADRIAEAQRAVFTAHRNGALGGLSRRELRLAAAGFFLQPMPPGRDANVASALLGEIGRRGSRRAILSLIDQYRRFFAAGDVDILRLARWLDSVRLRWTFREAAAWRKRGDEGYFDPGRAPAAVAAAVMEGTFPVSDALEASGVAGTVALAEAAFAVACDDIRRRRPVDPQRQLRLIDWAGGSRNDFVYPRVFAPYAHALLEPWHNTNGLETISAAHRGVTIAAIQRHGGGDPRTKGRPRWSETGLSQSAAHKTLLGWLTRASVFQFFDIVDALLKAHGGDEHWRYRRPFWTSYLDAGFIEEAWVVFGTTGAKLARDAAQVAGDPSLRTFGQTSQAYRQNNAALLLRIGSLRIVDWSHNGRYHFWTERTAAKAPPLYESNYDVLPDGEIYGAHTGTPSYGWQRTIADIIHRYTSRRTSEVDWKPRN